MWRLPGKISIGTLPIEDMLWPVYFPVWLISRSLLLVEKQKLWKLPSLGTSSVRFYLENIEWRFQNLVIWIFMTRLKCQNLVLFKWILHFKGINCDFPYGTETVVISHSIKFILFSFGDEDRDDMEYTTTSPGISNSDNDDFDLNTIESLQGTCSKLILHVYS